MSNDKTITETLPVLTLKLFWMGLGVQCESEELEDVVGIGSNEEQAINSFLGWCELKYDVDPKDIKYTVAKTINNSNPPNDGEESDRAGEK